MLQLTVISTPVLSMKLPTKPRCIRPSPPADPPPPISASGDAWTTGSLSHVELDYVGRQFERDHWSLAVLQFGQELGCTPVRHLQASCTPVRHL